MGGLWRKLWWRALCVWGFVFGVGAVAAFVFVALPVLLSPHQGVLDFAGGAVVHLGPAPVLLVPVWLAVEAYNLRRKVPVPFGSYVAFLVVYTATLSLTAWLLYVQVIETGRGAFPILLYMVACGTGLSAGWAYARLIGKRLSREGLS